MSVLQTFYKQTLYFIKDAYNALLFPNFATNNQTKRKGIIILNQL